MDSLKMHENLRSELISKILEDKSTEEILAQFNICVHDLVYSKAREILNQKTDSALIEEI